MFLLLIVLTAVAMLFMNAFAITGFKLATEEGNILYFLREWGEKHLSVFWQKPLYECPTCMASFHSVYFVLPCIIFLDWRIIFLWPVYILCLAGVSTFIYRLTEILWRGIDKLTETEEEKWTKPFYPRSEPPNDPAL